MSDSFIQIAPDGLGKRVDNSLLTVAGKEVYRQRVEAYAGENIPTQMYGYHEPTGEDRRVRVYDGHLNVANYLDSIGMGKIANHVQFGGFGQRSACSAAATGDDIWEGTATTCPIPDQTVGEQMTILCANSADTNGGTGINTLDVHGLDAVGNPQSEVVVLNGGSVNTIRTDWRFIQSIHAETVGTGGVAAGTISIHRTGTAARVYNTISAGVNMSLNAARMVPAGKTFYLKTLSICAASGKSMSIKLRSTSTFEDTLTTGYFFLLKTTCFLLNATCVKDFSIPLKFPALCVIKATAWSAQSGGDVAFNWSGWYE